MTVGLVKTTRHTSNANIDNVGTEFDNIQPPTLAEADEILARFGYVEQDKAVAA